MAKKRPPLPVSIGVDIKRRISEEGQPFSINIVNDNQTFGGSLLIKALTGGTTIYPGWVFIPDWAIIKSNRELGLYINVGTGAPTGYFSYQLTKIGDISHHSELLKVTELSSINAIAERFSASDGDAPFWVRGSIGGKIIYQGYDREADFNILIGGDSIFQQAASGSVPNKRLFQGKLIDLLTNPDRSVRIVNKAKGSANSTNWVNLNNIGGLDISEQVDLRIEMLGTNDVIQTFNANGGSLSPAQITTLINAFIANLTIRLQNHIRQYGNSVPLIILAPTPLYNTVQESAMIQLRNAERDYMESIGCGIWKGGNTPIAKPANNIWFGSFGTTSDQAGVFTANIYDHYVEKTGNAVHPAESGSGFMYTYLANMIIVNAIVD